MANPQYEDGYTKIANEILESLAKTRIPGEARQIFDVILRKTYGYNKKEDSISLSQFYLATGILKQNICASLKQLKSMNLIIQKDNKIANIYSINKDYSTWKSLSKKITPLSKKIIKNKETQQTQGLEVDNLIIQKDNDNEIIIQKDNESLSKKRPTKENNIYNNNIYNNNNNNIYNNNIYSRESIEYRLSELLFSLIQQRDEKYKQPNFQTWSYEIDKLIRIDKRMPGEIESVIRWSQKLSLNL